MNKNKNKNKINANNDSTTKLRLGILAISVMAVFMISPSAMQYAYATDGPIITSLIVDDPDDLDDVYSVDDTITITFDSDTNEPGGIGIQSVAAVNDLFTFTESVGQGYIGQWNTPDTFTITIKNINNATLIIGTTTVTPAGTTPILSADETSDASSTTSPVLSGDFGVVPFPNPWMDGGSGVIYYDGGNVGIGTTEPTTKLHLKGDYGDSSWLTIEGTHSNAYNAAGINILASASSPNSIATGISFSDKDGGASSITYYHFTDGNPIDYMRFLVNSTDVMLFGGNGNVGIGTGLDTPVAKLHISSPNSDETETILKVAHRADDKKVGARIELGGNYEGVHIARITGYSHPHSNSASQLEFETTPDGVTWNSMYMDEYGKVGIGTTSPNSKLEVTNGYFELDTSSGLPPSTDCDDTDEIGRMKVDDSTTDLYICTSSGWVTK